MPKEYIERERLLQDIEHYHLSDGKFQHWVEIQPAADVAAVQHGRWEAWMPDKNGETREFICTGCRFMVEMSWKQKECDYEWCPYCGCKMDKEEPNEL